MSLVSRLRVLRFNGLFVATMLLQAAGTALADEPARLRITVDPAVVNVGSAARVRVEILDRNFRPALNDRRRIIRFEIRMTGGRTQGSGSIDPTELSVRAGASSDSTVSFVAKGAGSVRIWAGSDELAAGEALVTVVSKTASLTSWIMPLAHAQEAAAFELLPTQAIVSFNGLSTAELWIALSEPPTAAAIWRITTTATHSPRIRYEDQQAIGLMTLRIEADNQSKPITIEPLALEDFDVIARRLPDGNEARVPIRVVAPAASRVTLSSDTMTLAPDQDLVALKVGLVDADGVPLMALARKHEIELRSATTAWDLAPVQLTLGPDKPVDHRKLTRPMQRFGAKLNLIASDVAGTLGPGAITIDVTPFRSAVFLFAIFGGLLGGLTRHIYRERSACLWVHRVKDRLKPGLVLNVLFGGLFGVVLFQMIDLGVHSVAIDVEHAEARWAFILGLAGGFAGVLVVENLAESVMASMKRALPSASRLAN